MLQLKYPETLVKMWLYSKSSEEEILFTEQNFADAWEQIKGILKKEIKNLPNMSDESDCTDAANDFFGDVAPREMSG